MASKCKSDFEKLSSHVRIFSPYQVFQIANFFQFTSFEMYFSLYKIKKELQKKIKMKSWLVT